MKLVDINKDLLLDQTLVRLLNHLLGSSIHFFLVKLFSQEPCLVSLTRTACLQYMNRLFIFQHRPRGEITLACL